MIRLNGPCPVCHLPDGFHEDEAAGPHSAARDRIPAHLKRHSNTVLRREGRRLAVSVSGRL